MNFCISPQHNINEVKHKYGTVKINVHAQPIFTNTTLNKLSDREKYVFGNGTKSPINDIKNKLPKYRATFKFVSKNIVFLQICRIIIISTSRTDVGVAVGRVPRVSVLGISEPPGRKFIFCDDTGGTGGTVRIGRLFVAIISFLLC